MDKLTWDQLKKIAVDRGFIDNGDEVEIHFKNGYVCFLKDGRAVFNSELEFSEMKQAIESEGMPWQK